jgi:uncharacterized membrane protein YfcA
MEYIIVGFVAFFASLLSFFSGFGLGTLLMPVFVLFFPVDIAISLTAIVHFLNNIVKLLLTGRKVDKYVYIRFGLTAIPAAFLGALILISLMDSQKEISYEVFNHTFTLIPVNAVIGSILVLFAILDLSNGLKRFSFDKNKLWIGGMLSGFFGGLSGHQGALRSAFLINFGLSKESFIATGIAIALTVDLVRMTTYASKYVKVGFSDHISILLVAVIAAFSGAVAGRILLKKITIQSIRNIVAILLVIVGIGLITGLI